MLKENQIKNSQNLNEKYFGRLQAFQILLLFLFLTQSDSARFEYNLLFSSFQVIFQPYFHYSTYSQVDLKCLSRPQTQPSVSDGWMNCNIRFWTEILTKVFRNYAPAVWRKSADLNVCTLNAYSIGLLWWFNALKL